eukprot:s5162_g3.t1
MGRRKQIRAALLLGFAVACSIWRSSSAWSAAKLGRRATLAMPVLPILQQPSLAEVNDIQWNEPKRKKTSLGNLADDFTRAFQQTQWGVNGRVQPRFFDDKFVFRDPDVTTNGLQEYSKGTGAVLSNCKADAIDT